jgi:hypothetical protein
MTDKTIDGLTTGAPALGTDQFPIQRGTSNFYLTLANAATYLSNATFPIGSTTPSTGAFSTISATGAATLPTINGTAATFTGAMTLNGTLTGTAVTNYFASPPAIGGTAAASGTFTGLTATTSVTTPNVVSPLVNAADLSGTNVTGTDTVLRAGNGTGTGGSGSVRIQVASAGSSGVSADTMFDAITVDNMGVVNGANVNLSLQRQTVWASTTGTSNSWIIPSWAKKITIIFSGVSNTGAAVTDIPLIQLGVGTSPIVYATSGYLGCQGAQLTTGVNTKQYSAGFLTYIDHAATYVNHGIATLTNVSGTKWVYSCTMGLSDTARTSWGGGSKDIGAALTAIRVTTEGPSGTGTSTFTAGTINLLIE